MNMYITFISLYYSIFLCIRSLELSWSEQAGAGFRNCIICLHSTQVSITLFIHNNKACTKMDVFST